MLGHDLTDLRITEFDADPLTDFGMMARGLDTEGLGNIMEQRPGRYLREIRQWFGGTSGSVQSVNQSPRYPGNHKGMGPDIIEHFIAIEKFQTLAYGWNVGRRNLFRHTILHGKTAPRYKKLSAAQFMDRINGNSGLLGRGELVNAVAEIENMAMGIYGVFQQSADSRPQPVFGQH